MVVRFRKSIKLAPGIRWNVSGSGSSWTFGPKGASVGVGKRGTFLNTGIPGTGFSSRTKLSGGSEARRQPQRATGATTTVSMTCGIRDDGTLYFQDATGTAMPDHLVELAKKQNKDAILNLIRLKCDEINGQIEALGRLHHDTPDARAKPTFVPPAFEESEPAKPIPRALRLLDKLFSSRRRRVEEANRAAEEAYQIASLTWRRARAAFEVEVAQRKEFVETLIYREVSAMETFLAESLQDIAWPRETEVAVGIMEEGTRVMLDVDLPEIEDMPTKLAAVPARGLKLAVKDLTATKVQRLYAEHVHAVLYRLIGEVFAALPTVQTVVASGYSQRRDAATAQLRDDYLLSVRVVRRAWEDNDFEHLDSIDVVEALSRYELRRHMLKSGLLKAIEPYES